MIRYGDRADAAIRYGDKPLTAVYHGSRKIWPVNIATLSSTIASMSSMSAAMSTRSARLGGSVAASSAIRGALQVSRHLSATIAPNSHVSGRISVSKPGILDAAIAAHSGISGALQVPRHLGAASSATSSVSGDIDTDPAPTSYSFTMTAEDYGGGTFVGFSSGTLDGFPEFGSIVEQPTPPVLAFYSSFFGVAGIAVEGDMVSAWTGKTVWVDGVEYPFDVDWDYDSENNATIGQWGPAMPSIEDGLTYVVEIK